MPRVQLTSEDTRMPEVRTSDARARPPPSSTTAVAPFSGSTAVAPFFMAAAAPPSSTDPRLHPPWRRLHPPWLPPPPAPTTASTRAASTDPLAPSSISVQPPGAQPRPGIATHSAMRPRPGGLDLGPTGLDLGSVFFLFLEINFSYQSTPAGTKYA
jgi:hypothetical protein